MTARTTPELLRAAATRLREVAGKASEGHPGPWRNDDVFGVMAANGDEVADCWGLTYDLIATMDPVVATALADLLDAEAAEFEAGVGCYDCAHAGPYDDSAFAEAITLARAVLKEPHDAPQ